MRELSVVEQRYQAVLAVIGDGETVTEVAAAPARARGRLTAPATTGHLGGSPPTAWSARPGSKWASASNGPAHLRRLRHRRPPALLGRQRAPQDRAANQHRGGEKEARLHPRRTRL